MYQDRMKRRSKMEQKSLCIIVSRKHLLIAAVLVLIALVWGGRAYSYPMKVNGVNARGNQLTTKEKKERYQSFFHWVHSTKPRYMFVPLRSTTLAKLNGEKGIVRKYKGFVKEIRNTKTVYYVAISRDGYRNYFLNRRWKHLSQDKQRQLWNTRTKKSQEIMRRLSKWLPKAASNLPQTRTPLPDSYSDLQGSYYMDNYKWLITVDLHGGDRTATVKFYYKNNSHTRGYSYGGRCNARFVPKDRFKDNYPNPIERDCLVGNMTWVKWKNDDPAPLTPRNPATPRPPRPLVSPIRLWVKGYSTKQPRIPYIEFRMNRPPWLYYTDLNDQRGSWTCRAQDLSAKYNHKKWWPKSGF
jgi:hypothetical protein